MKQVNVQEAKTQLSRLLSLVEAGEEIVIARYGDPVARLVRITPPAKKRRRGTMKGMLTIAEDFNDEVEDLWMGNIEP